MIRSFSGTHEFDPSVLMDTDAEDMGNAYEIVAEIELGNCPRCWGKLPEPPEFPAGSRVTRCRSIPICGRCGSDEATEASGEGVTSAGSWPVLEEEMDRREAWVAAHFRPAAMVFVDGNPKLLMDTGVAEVTLRPNPGGLAEFGENLEL